MRRIWKAGAVAVAATLVAAFFLAPIVGYSQSVVIPNDFEPGAYAICFGPITNSTAVLNQSQIDQAIRCMYQHLYPPTKLTGQASLVYGLFGLGPPPFPPRMSFSVGNYSAVVFFNGSRAYSAYEFLSRNITLDPRNAVQVVNASFERTGYGDVYFLASVKNVGTAPVSSVGVDLLFPGAQKGSFEPTFDGLAWFAAGADGSCSIVLRPGQTCNVRYMFGNETLAAQEVHLIVGVVGNLDGNLFYYGQDVDLSTPQQGLNKDWVGLFLGRVDQARQGPPLVENATLDTFAALRFKTASSQPQISDYGFGTDAASFFGAGDSHVAELLLFPGTATPYVYATEVQGSAPGHWSGLTDPSFTQYGYYIGHAPYYQVSADCPVTEVPSGGVNITQYFEAQGCTVTPVADMPWLVVVLSP